MLMIVLCSVQVLVFGLSWAHVLSPTGDHYMSFDGMLTMAWVAALLGWACAHSGATAMRSAIKEMHDFMARPR